jgi:hypothetical protein
MQSSLVLESWIEALKAASTPPLSRVTEEKDMEAYLNDTINQHGSNLKIGRHLSDPQKTGAIGRQPRLG